MEIALSFECRRGNANDGKIVATFHDNMGTSSSPYTIGLGAVSPTGVLLADYNVNGAILPIGGTVSLYVTIPKDSSGNYLAGVYELTVNYYNIEGTDNRLETYAYQFDPHSSPDHLESDLVKLETVLDCDAKTLVATDTSDYTDVTRLTRALTITPPSVAGASPSTTSGATVTAAVTYTYVTYSTLLNVSFEYNEETPDDLTTLISYGSAYIYAENYVDCDVNLCALTQCLAAKFQSLKSQSQAAGGVEYLPQNVWANFQYAQSLVVIASQLRNCGLYDAAQPYVNEASTLLSCDCGCDQNTNPQPLT